MSDVLTFPAGTEMATVEDSMANAVIDPEYHRFLIFGPADKVRRAQLGRPLRSHELQGRIRGPQLEIIRRIERAIVDRRGDTLTIRMARQTGKNETEAHLEDRALMIWQGVPGSVWVRCAPTWRPQIINSKTRLEKFVAADPFVRNDVRWREGFICQHGTAQVHFLSGGAQANVLGGTASIALSVDEAHKIDRGKFEEEFMPFTASTNAPTLLWGVGADKTDLLYEFRSMNEGTDRHLEYPASVWCELSESFRSHYEKQVRRLGASHPVILTQYDLVDVEAVGAYLNPAQRAALFSGQHSRLEAPRERMAYACVIDLGGESEVDDRDEVVRLEEPQRDSTVVWILEYDPREKLPQMRDDPKAGAYRTVRVVAGYWWTGREHLGVLRDLQDLLRHWRVQSGCCDARGVGEAVAMALHKSFPGVTAYKATWPDVSTDCFDLLARLNAGRVRFWRADPDGDPELREAMRQARHTKYEIRGHEEMRLIKPEGSDRHIDGIKALTYIHRALRVGGKIMTAEGRRTHRDPFDGDVTHLKW